MYYFLVYDDGSHMYNIDILLNSVSKYSDFKIIRFRKEDMDIEFVNKNKDILSLQRGGGYWLWKPYIINETLKKLNDGDILYYMDSSYYFINSFECYMNIGDIVIWKNKPNESSNFMKHYCKMDLIVNNQLEDKVFNQNVDECWAGSMIIKKSDTTVKYMNEWLDLCTYENITDSPSKLHNPFFRDHRHDQSVLSVIVHKYNIPLHYFEKGILQNVRRSY